MSSPTLWERVRTGGKSGFDKTWQALDKLGAPVNKLTNKLGSEAFWPTTLDKESDKAARILKTFCTDGFYTEEDRPPEDGPKQRQKVIKKIPTNVIKNAKGLAIFTTMRSGLWVSGAGGSGVLIARKPDGSWSPPSGILLHTAGLGFLVGIDIYDCVIVINNDAALEAFTKIRCTVGSEISVAAGPVGAGGILDSEVHKRQAAIFTYLKSRGFYAGVQIDGTVIIERTDENERFYGRKIGVKDILAGKVTHPPYEVRRLLETIKAAQGDTDVDESILPTEPPPGDYEIDDGHIPSVPDPDDPDPYGVLALEKEGMSIKEAGTQKRASWEAFTFSPAPTSPVHTMVARQSMDTPRSATVSRRSSWRASAPPPSSTRLSRDFAPPPSQRTSLVADSSTQTDDLPEPPSTPGRRSFGDSLRSSRASFGNGHHSPSIDDVPEDKVLDTKEPDSASHVNGYTTPPRTPPMNSAQKELDEDNEDATIEEPVVHSVQVQTVQPASPQVVSKARLIDVPKRVPPKLPPRNPNRGAGPLVVDASPEDAPTDTATAEPVPEAKDEPVTEVALEKEPGVEPGVEPAEDKTDDVETTKDKMDDVRLDDDADAEEDDVERPNPWAKVEEVRKRESQGDESPRSPRIPGGFV